MTRWSVSEARAALPEILDRVSAGEEVTVTRHGQPVAVIVRPDVLRARRVGPALAAAAELRAKLDVAHRGARPRKGVTRRRADEHVAELRSHRDDR